MRAACLFRSHDQGVTERDTLALLQAGYDEIVGLALPRPCFGDLPRPLCVPILSFDRAILHPVRYVGFIRLVTRLSFHGTLGIPDSPFAFDRDH